MLPHDRTEAPGPHSGKQDSYQQGDSSQQSLKGHLRNSFQEKLLSNKELTLDKVYTHPKWNTHTKARSYSHPHCTGISQQDPGSDSQDEGKCLFHSSDPQSWYPKANNQNFIPFTKKRVGVDRAYPLKPVVHRKSCSMGEAGTDGDQNVYPRPPELREFLSSNAGVRDQVNFSVVGTVLAAVQEERAAVNFERTEQVQIRRLEAAGENLEEEIRRKQILLRGKLKKTEEELRRIQKQKEQARENDNRELQKIILSRRRVKGNNSNTTYKPIFSPDSEFEEEFGRDRRQDEAWGWSQQNSSPFQLSDYRIQRLKRERNNKIRDQVSDPSMEKFSLPSETPGGSLQGSARNSSLSKAPDSSGSGGSVEEPQLGECSHCGRKFLLLRLKRHSTICSRMRESRRKVFDSSRARAKGTELEQYLKWKGPTSVKAQEVQQVIAKGGNPSDLPPILPSENPDYIQCPHCGRHFAPKVAEQHIPKSSAEWLG
ncbi:Zinc finger C2HC domain-containing protein 1C [Plecturocebus cupreus]